VEGFTKACRALANNFSKAELVALCDLEEEKAHELKHSTRPAGNKGIGYSRNYYIYGLPADA